MLLPLPNNACTLCGRRAAVARGAPASGGTRCTGRCGRSGLEPRDYALESALLLELQQRPAGTRLTLHGALANQVAFDDETEVARARNAAQRLAARGQLELVLHGRAVGEVADDVEQFEVRLPRA